MDHSKIVVIPEEMTKRKNIFEIYRKFDADGSGGIDQDELKVLLDELQVDPNPSVILLPCSYIHGLLYKPRARHRITP